MARRWLIVLTLVAASAHAGEMLDKLGVRRGICVVVGERAPEVSLDLAKQSELTLCLQANRDRVDRARKLVNEAGLLNTRVFVVEGLLEHIRLADNVADAFVDTSRRPALPRGEVLRVLRPGGKAMVAGQEFVKPWPKGTDDWSHHYHGPDNNSQSQDKLARAPYLTQFIAEPRYGAAPQACVASAGRVFMAFGNVAWHEREEPMLETLIAVNGFNGTMLWKRKLPSGIMVDRCTMIAAPDALYLADDESCKLLDPDTGVVKDQIVVSKDVAGGTFWKWMALDDGVLYALVGEAEKPDAVAKWRRRGHGWPWGGISDGYNKGPYRWGFASTLLAIDPKTKKVLWRHAEPVPIDSRGICMKGGRIYCCAFGKYVACLDAKNGQEVWRRTAEKDPGVFQAIGPYRPGHGYVGGWKSTVFLKCSDQALYVVGPQVNWLSAFAAADGRFLWKFPAKDLHIVLRDDGLYTIGPQKSQGLTRKLDPMTGKVLASFPVSRRACTRSVGTADGIFFRASGGSVRLDLASGKPQWISPMRPPCHIGVVVAHGHLYWMPWVCDCNLQMFGAIACAPAGDFAFDQAAEADRLDANNYTLGRPSLGASPTDWPTYRGNNARTAATQAAVAAQVEELWTAQCGPEATAPVVAGGHIFVADGCGVVRALDAATGKPRWTAYTGGQVHYPPTIAQDCIYVGSADGFVYCFEAVTGSRLWRFRAAPVERRIPVYGKLISTWPVASGVLVDKGVAYFACGINNFDGTHVYALDATTGRVQWQNNTCGHLDAFSRRGVGCQGDLLLHQGKLYLAGGNAVSPGVFDVGSGKCLTPPPSWTGSNARRGRELRLAGNKVDVSGQPLYSTPENPVFSGECNWQPWAVSAKNAVLSCQQRGGGWHLVATKPGTKQELWAHKLPAEPIRWGIAVDAAGRIAVTLRNGQIACFGQKG